MKKTVIALALYIFLVAPVTVFGSSLFFEVSSNDVHIGDTIVVQAFLDTADEEINVLDGELFFSDSKKFSISEITTANSAFSLWPNKPSVDITRSLISFVGGVPNGLKGSRIPLFKIIIEPKKEGSITIEGKSVSQYLSDGKGTPSQVTVKPITITALQNTGQLVVNEWTQVLQKDTTPPGNFSIDIGRDQSIYDNRYFISFNSIDDDSGIDYYEVQEGNLPKVRSGSPYVLQNQNSKEKIIVTAYDNAGNSNTATLNGSHALRYALITLSVTILLVFFMRKYIRNKFFHESKQD